MELKFSNIEKYKYRLDAPYTYKLNINLNYYILYPGRINGWIDFDGKYLMFSAGYCWDGSSGPTIDSKRCQRGSLIHDGAYQLLRRGVFDEWEHNNIRKYFDDLYKQICLEDNMHSFQAWWRHRALRMFGGKAARRCQ